MNNHSNNECTLEYLNKRMRTFTMQVHKNYYVYLNNALIGYNAISKTNLKLYFFRARVVGTELKLRVPQFLVTSQFVHVSLRNDIMACMSQC